MKIYTNHRHYLKDYNQLIKLKNLHIPHFSLLKLSVYKKIITGDLYNFIISLGVNTEKIIYDPFCGTGELFLFTNKNHAKCIGADISPLAKSLIEGWKEYIRIGEKNVLDIINNFCKEFYNYDKIDKEFKNYLLQDTIYQKFFYSNTLDILIKFHTLKQELNLTKSEERIIQYMYLWLIKQFGNFITSPYGLIKKIKIYKPVNLLINEYKNYIQQSYKYIDNSDLSKFYYLNSLIDIPNEKIDYIITAFPIVYQYDPLKLYAPYYKLGLNISKLEYYKFKNNLFRYLYNCFSKDYDQGIHIPEIVELIDKMFLHASNNYYIRLSTNTMCQYINDTIQFFKNLKRCLNDESELFLFCQEISYQFFDYLIPTHFIISHIACNYGYSIKNIWKFNNVNTNKKLNYYLVHLQYYKC